MSGDFWDWLPKAYGEVSDEPVFTKYNMEVAFAAGAENEAKRMWVDIHDNELFDIWMKSPAETEDRFAFVKKVMTILKERNA
jgi:hypothetical protein